MSDHKEVQEQPKVLRVIDVESRKDKNDNPYLYVTVECVEDKMIHIPGVGEVKVAGDNPRASYTAYPTNINGKPDPGSNAQKGGYLLGTIVTRETVPYTIVGRDGIPREYNKATYPVFGNSTDDNWETKIEATFSRNQTPLKGSGVAPTQSSPVSTPESPESTEIPEDDISFVNPEEESESQEPENQEVPENQEEPVAEVEGENDDKVPF